RWNSRGHFFAAAAEAMRRILIEQARRKRSQRHGGGGQPWPRPHEELRQGPRNRDVLHHAEAHARRTATGARAPQLARRRPFAGMTIEEIAQLQGVSARTVKRNWAFARAWLGRELAAYDERKS